MGATVSLFFDSFDFKRKKTIKQQKNKNKKASQSHNSAFVELDYTMNAIIIASRFHKFPRVFSWL